MFTNYTSTTLLAPSPGSGNPAVAGTGFLVGANNPFIPDDLRTILNSRLDPNAPFTLNKRFSSAGGRNDTEESTNYQSLIGIKGDVPGYDLTSTSTTSTASYGHFNDTGTQHRATSATPTLRSRCWSTQRPRAAARLLQLQPLRHQHAEAAPARLSSGPTTKNQTEYTQKVVEGDFQGKAFDIPTFDVLGGSLGGTVRFAAGPRLSVRPGELPARRPALLG